MEKRVGSFLVAMAIGGLVACGGPDVGDAASGSASMRRALECQNCPSPHRIEEEGDASGCGVGETCNPPGPGGTRISCTDGSTSHEGNTCDGAVPAAR